MRRAFSLLETLIAVFILIAAFCVFAALQHFTLVSSAQADRRTVAARLARNRLQSLRGWARQGTNWDSGDWNALAAPTSEPGYELFRTSVHVLEAALYSPSSALRAPSDPVDLSAASRRVRIHVEFGSDRFDLFSQLGAPRGNPTGISVTLSGPGPVPVGGSLDLQAVTVMVAGSGPVMGMVYRWNVLPGTGSGTVVPLTSGGSQARFINEIRTPSGTLSNPAPGPRSCRVTATAYYAGKELTGTSAPILLQTP